MMSNNFAGVAGASVPPVVAREIVLSLGRIVADQVRVDATEAYAVLQHVWERMLATRDKDGGIMGCPPLDAMGITPFGDFEVRRAATTTGDGSARPADDLTRELGGLWLRLLASGNPGLANVPAAGIDAARRTAATGPLPPGVHPIVSPDALFRAIDAFRPGDGSGALATLYGRWSRTTDAGQIGVGAAQSPTSPARRPGPPQVAAAASPLAPASITPDPDTRTVSAVAVPPARGRGAGRQVAAVLLALACILLSGVLGWRWMLREPDAVAVDGAATRADLPRATSPTGPGVSRDEEPRTDDVAPPPPPPPTTFPVPIRVRRVLDAARTGRVPYSPSFDPRTHGLVFHAGRDKTALLQASLNSDGSVGEVSTVIDDGSRSYHVQVSPDGERLAYDSDVDGTRGVYVANRDGSSPRRVSGQGHASVPTWSPDGQRLAIVRAEVGRPRVWNIWAVHVPTGTLRRLTAHRVGQPWGASWFPDGERIAYSLEDRLIVLDVRTDTTRTYRTPVPGRLLRTPAVSPDGQHIVFQVHRDGAWVLDLRTGQQDRLLSDPTAQEFAWSPDGRQLAYHSVRGGGWGIWLMEMAETP